MLRLVNRVNLRNRWVKRHESMPWRPLPTNPATCAVRDPSIVLAVVHTGMVPTLSRNLAKIGRVGLGPG